MINFLAVGAGGFIGAALDVLVQAVKGTAADTAFVCLWFRAPAFITLGALSA